MRTAAISKNVAKWASVTLWAAVVCVPLAFLAGQALVGRSGEPAGHMAVGLFGRTVGLAGLIAGVSVVLGIIPGRMLGLCRRPYVLLFLLLVPLVLPRYVLYYAWSLLLSPTTVVGGYLAQRTELAQFVGAFSSSAVLILWYWPLAALLIGQGWRNIDRGVFDAAALEAGAVDRFVRVTLPMIWRPLLLAFGVCFVLSLSEFTTFHLAGMATVGTELAVLYELTGSESAVVRAAWPLALPALAMAVILGRSSSSWVAGEVPVEQGRFVIGKWQGLIVALLLTLSCGVPLLLLVGHIRDMAPFAQFFRLHLDELGWSLVVAAGAAVMAHVIAYPAIFWQGRGGWENVAAQVVRVTIYLVMFLPASLMAVALLKLLASGPIALRQSWLVVSAGQAGRFAGVALILMLLGRQSRHRQVSEMTALDGANSWQCWRWVHLPQTWPLVAGAFLVITMLSMTEIAGTMVLLPAWLPNFAQTLLNQMHYARDQQVIASSLVLIGVFVGMALMVVLLLGMLQRSRQMAVICGLLLALAPVGCTTEGASTGAPDVIDVFGTKGQGQGEFIYPRAIDRAPDGSLIVVDKGGRLQRLSPEGQFLEEFVLPKIDSGKPVGLRVGPDGRLYVADTHNHRVLIFSSEGEVVGQFGRFGEEEGCFIYPTDVAFSGDGRIFVSEYGGNDRISVFDEAGGFLSVFGAVGSGEGELSRPSALEADHDNELLYVADACNHRIAIYTFEGQLRGYIGAAGRAAGELRYPYDLKRLGNGNLVVCEYGNNRIQVFDREGQSVGVYGQAGHSLGELAGPWGLAVDERDRVYVLDSLNDRIQVWQL